MIFRERKAGEREREREGEKRWLVQALAKVVETRSFSESLRFFAISCDRKY